MRFVFDEMFHVIVVGYGLRVVSRAKPAGCCREGNQFAEVLAGRFFHCHRFVSQ